MTLSDLPGLVKRAKQLDAEVETIKLRLITDFAAGEHDGIWALQFQLVEIQSSLDQIQDAIAAARKAHRTGWPG